MTKKRYNSTKMPKIGDKIEHYEPYFRRTNQGTVTELLSMQFVYKTDTNEERYCLYRENWKCI